MLIASIGFSQAKYVEIFVDNGEYIKGELIAIGSDILLVRSGDRVESIERESIRLVLPTKPSKQSSRISTRTTGSYRNAARPTASNRPQLKHGYVVYTVEAFRWQLGIRSRRIMEFF